jgi:hypothetical protein
VVNIEMYFGEKYCGVNWIGLSQERGNWGALMNVVMNLDNKLVVPRVVLSFIE